MSVAGDRDSKDSVDFSLHPPDCNTTNTRKQSTITNCYQTPASRKGQKLRPMSLFEYLKAELTRGYLLELEEERFAARREKVYTFISIPRELEKLMGYGFFQCADAFLFLFTFLPLRCVIALFGSLRSHISFNRFGWLKLKAGEKCDLLKIGILMSCVYLFSYIDTSVLYHVIKSQSVIKLYIFFNMLEVGDRLFASFVQDTLDALFLTATEKSDKKSRMGVTAHVLLTIFSVFGHALVILLQGTTLSVAINASNRALLTVMMSNNFVELKGAVFKKFDKINLFQVSCSDVRERFHLCVLLLVVCLQTMREYSWEESRFWVLFPDCLMVLLAEVGVDWLKHAFITRFNEIPADVYREYTLSLAYDLAQTKQRRAFSDHSDMVGRRLGFVPLPLAVVLARVIRPSLKGPLPSTIILVTLGYVALASFRVLNSIILLGKACDLIDGHIKSTTPSHTLPENVVLSADIDGTKFRVGSHPTTRTPSPVRGLAHDKEPEGLEESRSIPPSPATQKKDPKLYRSFSASHTPRPSVCFDTLPSLGEAPALPDASIALLMANSSVSILSVSLNEEMLRAAKKDSQPKPGGKDNAATSLSEGEEETHIILSRKHSLGSNLDNELSFNVSCSGFLQDDHNTTVIEASGFDNSKVLNASVSKENIVAKDLDVKLIDGDKENVFSSPVASPVPKSSGTSDKDKERKISGELDKENVETSDSTEGVVKRKKKGLAWLLSH